jgi:Effector protein
MQGIIRRGAPAAAGDTTPEAPSTGNPAQPAGGQARKGVSGKLSALSNLTNRESASTRSAPGGAAPAATAATNPKLKPTDVVTRWDGLIIRPGPNDSKKFPGQVNAALEKIASTPTGNQLLNDIATHQGNDRFGYKVAITANESQKNKRLFRPSRQYQGGSVTTASSDTKASTPGDGTSSSIKWNPAQTDTPDGRRPVNIGLAHELIHARHNLKGESSLLNTGNGDPKIEDEHRVVGLGQFADEPITENKLRAEQKVPLRTQYSGLPTNTRPARPQAAVAPAQAPAPATAAPAPAPAAQAAPATAHDADTAAFVQDHRWLAGAIK